MEGHNTWCANRLGSTLLIPVGDIAQHMIAVLCFMVQNGYGMYDDVNGEQIPGLEHLLAWARERSPAEVVDDAPDVLDLDAEGVFADPEKGIDADALTERMRGAAAVRGSILNSPEGAGAVVHAGVPVVARRPDQHAATVLLRLVQARQS